MGFLIDTNLLIEIENNNKNIIAEIDKLKHSSDAELFITIFNFCEVYYGAINKNKKNKEKVLQRLDEYKLLNTTKTTGIIFSELLSEMKYSGKLSPQFDLFIATLAIENNLTLITADNHFKNVSKLKLVVFENLD